MKQAPKVNIFCLLFVTVLMVPKGYYLNAQEVSKPDSIKIEKRYAHFSECLQSVFLKADEIAAEKGKEQEINWLKSQNYSCERSGPVTRTIAVRYLEWGDDMYGIDGNEGDVDKKELFLEGLQWAKDALRQDTTDYLNYEVMSMAYAATITVSGLRRKAELADSVRIYAEDCVAIQPTDDRAYHILGRWHYEISKLGRLVKFLSKVIFREPQDGSFEKAVEYFNKALALDDIPTHRYWLGLAYLETGEKDEALRQFKTLLNLDEQMHNDAYFKEKAREMIDKYE